MSIEILHADVLDLDASFFEMFATLITDPPYSEHVHSSAASVGTAGMFPGTQNNRDRDLGFASLSDALRAKIAEAAGSVSRWSLIFSDVESTHLWRDACALPEYIRPIPWIRWSQPQLSGDRPCTVLEIISCFHRQEHGPRGGVKPAAKHWNGPGNIMPAATRELFAPLLSRAMRGVDKHPTEKPIDQLLDLVSWFSDPGETVLGLCAGAGTTAQACRLLGRDCVDVELDDTWARRAESRLKAPLSGRDADRAQEWAARVIEEVEAILVAPAAADGSDRNTRRRAEARIADASTVLGAL
jgi:site-specific DNA-methyltransferase (adenine-specific)